MMVCATTPSGSGHSAEAEALVYNFVKRKKPGLLLEMFGKERCRELEKRDHLYDRNSLLSMLKEVKGRLPVKEDAGGREQKKSSTLGSTKEHVGHTTSRKKSGPSQSDNGAIPGRNTIRITPELAVFNYFHERQQEEALEILFNEKTREDYGRKVDSMGIWMPPVRRIYAHYRFNEMKKENRGTMVIWKCELCKKDIKVQEGRGISLFYHIGAHEHIPCPCVVEGCDATFRMPPSLSSHLKQTHVLLSTSLNSEQYFKLQKVTRQFYKEAELFRDKYFPPEAFIGFNDRKTRNTAMDLEDPKCRECGAIVKDKTSRRTHVAGHLKLSYHCVFGGCSYKAEVTRMAAHFTARHKAKVGDLNKDQLFKYKQMKVDFAEVMRREVPNYFPYKSEVPEEGLFC